MPTNGHRSSLATFPAQSEGRTLREATVACTGTGSRLDAVGTPDGAASRMAEIMAEVGGDGFLIALNDVNRRSAAMVTTGWCPPFRVAVSPAPPTGTCWRSDRGVEAALRDVLSDSALGEVARLRRLAHGPFSS